jgi:hypothetical protein
MTNIDKIAWADAIESVRTAVWRIISSIAWNSTHHDIRDYVRLYFYSPPLGTIPDVHSAVRVSVWSATNIIIEELNNE